ncbi:MAG: peptide ABC transporter substrate-binding protein [Roseitalea porphyridii]|uniref:peptide ABC transporter substrate-binding protein n=1 Tax=Roseitalea porphyridii TaxID=1852022 RepID=UPI0032D914A0
MLLNRNLTAAAAATAIALLMAAPAHARVLNMHNGGDVTSLDPHKVSGDWENRVVGDIFEGLVTEDVNAEPIPGMAESWQISDDGLVYTFTLREDAVWSDGEPVTADDFVFAFQRLMDPETAADYAYLQYTIKNAEAINTGENEALDSLGVRALDDRTLEITLENPTPYLLSALTHYTAYPIPRHAVEANGDEWVRVENIVVNGPYKPTEWVPGSHVLTEINENYYDAGNLAIEGVKFFTLEDESAALKRYRAGEFDILTEFPTDQYQWMQENLPGEARVAPFAGLYYYAVNTQQEPFTDPNVRKALSMSINREVIGPQILGTGELPAYSWVPPGMANYGDPARVDWADMDYGAKVEEAKRLLEEAGFNEDNPLSLQLRYNTNENHKRIAVAVAAMWKPLGIEVELYNTETKVHYDELTKGILDVARAGWLADYNDAFNFLQLLETGVPFNYGRWSNEDYDALLDEQATITDLEERAAVMKEAEQIALDQSASIPIYYYISRNVVKPYIEGFEDNVFDIHRTRWMSINE